MTGPHCSACEMLSVQTIVGVENSNFYPVTVAMLNVSLMYYENEVGLYYSSPSFAVNSRTARNVRQNYFGLQSFDINLLLISSV